ncbi:MAG: carboxypeptidase regulatory-like domain-containing protein [bacterium]|nr:carboxypeptidase regulatory-like domain-containing protein [bacterium]
MTTHPPGIGAPRPGRLLPGLVSVALMLLLAAVPAGLLYARTYRTGDPVTITGQVSDAGGRPMAEVEVLLEVSRRTFKLRSFRREKRDTLRVPATTDQDGRYSIVWRWDSYYNTFELAVALAVRKAGRDSIEVFTRVDVTEQVKGGSPVVVPLVVEDTSYLESLREFLAGLASDDELRVYREMGRPDRIDAGESGQDPESSWWYFEAGKVYRFRGGELQQVTHFEPVKPL